MKKTLLVAALLGGTALASAPMADATVVATYNINGGGVTTLCTSATDTCNGSATVSGVAITTLGVQGNSPGTATLSDLFGSTISIVNNGATTATIDLVLSGDGYTLPTAPPAAVLLSNVGGTVLLAGAANTLSYFSTAGGISTAPLTPGIATAGSYNANNQAAVASLTTPYSLSETFTITLGAGSAINFSSSSKLEPVPEPGSLALLGTALVGIAGIGFLRRRRRA